MERAELLKLIRSKIVEGQIATIYPAPLAFQRHGGGDLCRACNEPILGNNVSIRYRIGRGEHHSFHVVCDAVRRTVAAKILSLGVLMTS